MALSLLVSFCEQFEIVWRSCVSITQGAIELKKKKKKSIVHSNNVLMLMIFVDYIENFVT